MSTGPGAGPAGRLTARFEGRVQGVGFRWSVCRLAAGRPVTGFVRNRPDGSVELVAEGAAAELRALLEAVAASGVGGFVRHTAVAWSPATGEFRSFGVAY